MSESCPESPASLPPSASEPDSEAGAIGDFALDFEFDFLEDVTSVYVGMCPLDLSIQPRLRM